MIQCQLCAVHIGSYRKQEKIKERCFLARQYGGVNQPFRASLIRYIIGLLKCSRGFIHEINYTTDESHLHVVHRNKSEPTSGHSHVLEDTSYLIMQSKRTCMLLGSIIATQETHTSPPPHQQFNSTAHTTRKKQPAEPTNTQSNDQALVSLTSYFSYLVTVLNNNLACLQQEKSFKKHYRR